MWIHAAVTTPQSKIKIFDSSPDKGSLWCGASFFLRICRQVPDVLCTPLLYFSYSFV